MKKVPFTLDGLGVHFSQVIGPYEVWVSYDEQDLQDGVRVRCFRYSVELITQLDQEADVADRLEEEAEADERHGSYETQISQMGGAKVPPTGHVGEIIDEAAQDRVKFLTIPIDGFAGKNHVTIEGDGWRLFIRARRTRCPEGEFTLTAGE